MRGETPDFTDAFGPNVEVEITRVAKATGTKCGDGGSVGLFIPLPKNLAKKFPSLGHEDTSPSHVTFLYIGDVKGEKEQKHLIQTLKNVHGTRPRYANSA